ncbi:hypothetical protein [Roseisolibacter agri]|uniref:Uncharacterized protein n=1 Tax=Roseisolibacter agri TaxID=2014610 RepID=A0AA37Q6I8_9BACT|nr:hypothetical protein [Roseisolibacter agri]GLC24632.1 hypothetical protein rosag_11450 [Roseisolibacter agri]
MWTLIRRYLAVAVPLIAFDALLGLLLATGLVPSGLLAVVALIFWTIIPLALLGRTLLLAYDALEYVRGGRPQASERHVT